MKTELKPLKEQVMVLTGASSGIGFATADLAASKGAKLVLVARSEEVLREMADEIVGSGGEAIYVVADVGHRSDVERVARVAIERFGRIDTWVNDAGVSIYGRLQEATDEDNRRLFDTNFWGVVYGSLIAVEKMRESGGALINVGSEVSEAVVPLQGMYSASKHAVKGFTDALRIELEVDEAPISVTLIQPTATDTPFPQHARNYMDQEPKLPTPQSDPYDVAEAICDAAEKPTRVAKVGLMSKMNTATAKFAPRLGDRMAAKQVNRQQLDQAPMDPAGTLFKPGNAGQAYGGDTKSPPGTPRAPAKSGA